MAQVELVMPKMGESIMEATILKWVKQVGDTVEMDETILEIATDKVDSEVPSPVAGTIAQILFEVDDVVEIGKVIAIIATEGEVVAPVASPTVEAAPASNGVAKVSQPVAQPAVQTVAVAQAAIPSKDGNRFYSPLVRNIAKSENISLNELEQIAGSGMNGRVTKKDMMAYVENRHAAPQTVAPAAPVAAPKPAAKASTTSAPNMNVSGNVEIVEMDRMRRLIADHMVRSKHTSPHVTSFIEVDVTDIVNWRNKVKGEFPKKYGEKSLLHLSLWKQSPKQSVIFL